MAKWQRNHGAEGLAGKKGDNVEVYVATLGSLLTLKVRGNDHDGWRAYVAGNLLGMAGYETREQAQGIAEEEAKLKLLAALEDLNAT